MATDDNNVRPWKAYRSDIARYVAYEGGSAIKQVLTQQGLWALAIYRVAYSIYASRLPRLAKRIVLHACLVAQKLTEVITGISLPYTARIGPGLYIGHFGNIIINAKAVIGENCNISQGVTIGVSGRGTKRGVPSIGNRVYIGANAVVAGDICIGDDSMIGANSLVTSDVEANCTVLGVPAVKLNDKGSEDYILLRNSA